jgi:hypothetical protein
VPLSVTPSRKSYDSPSVSERGLDIRESMDRRPSDVGNPGPSSVGKTRPASIDQATPTSSSKHRSHTASFDVNKSVIVPADNTMPARKDSLDSLVKDSVKKSPTSRDRPPLSPGTSAVADANGTPGSSSRHSDGSRRKSAIDPNATPTLDLMSVNRNLLKNSPSSRSSSRSREGESSSQPQPRSRSRSRSDAAQPDATAMKPSTETVITPTRPQSHGGKPSAPAKQTSQMVFPKTMAGQSSSNGPMPGRSRDPSPVNNARDSTSKSRPNAMKDRTSSTNAVPPDQRAARSSTDIPAVIEAKPWYEENSAQKKAAAQPKGCGCIIS